MSEGVIAFKTKNGDEVISKYKKEESYLEPIYELTVPMAIRVFQSPNGQFGMGLVPWFYSAPVVTFDLNDAIVHTFEPDADLVSNYLAEISPIELVQSQKKIIV